MSQVDRGADPPVRMGEMRVVDDGRPLHTLLGSCIGVAMYDRRSGVAGLAHVVLPQSREAGGPVGKFADTAIPGLVDQIRQLAKREVRLAAKLAGGASMFSSGSGKQIGQLNLEACETFLREMKIPVVASHCGGNQGRRMTLNTQTGSVMIEIVGQEPVELR